MAERKDMSMRWTTFLFAAMTLVLLANPRAAYACPS